MSVVGFDDVPMAPLLSPRLTTVRQPAREMGMYAAELLLDLVYGNGNVKPDMPETFPVEVIVRESTAAPRSA